MYDCLIGRATLAEVTADTEIPSLKIVPATQDLVAVEIELVDDPDRATRLKSALAPELGSYDYVFIDTPGIFEPKRRFDRAMVKAAWTGAGEGDVVPMLAFPLPALVIADLLGV